VLWMTAFFLSLS
jgi:hypothetical protein